MVAIRKYVGRRTHCRDKSQLLVESRGPLHRRGPSFRPEQPAYRREESERFTAGVVPSRGAKANWRGSGRTSVRATFSQVFLRDRPIVPWGRRTQPLPRPCVGTVRIDTNHSRSKPPGPTLCCSQRTTSACVCSRVRLTCRAVRRADSRARAAAVVGPPSSDYQTCCSAFRHHVGHKVIVNCPAASICLLSPDNAVTSVHSVVWSVALVTLDGMRRMHSARTR